MIPRTALAQLTRLADGFPVVTVTGPRQSGKTTLCRAAFPDKPYASLERPDTRAFAREDPRGFLAGFPDGAILDEIQRAPDLTSWLQPLVDENAAPGRFILTGSQNLGVSAATSQSLAGRSALLQLLPFERSELRETPHAHDPLWQTVWSGGYPAIFDRQLNPVDWLAPYVRTYIERDVRQLLAVGDLERFQTFVELCAGRTGNLLSLSDLGRDTGISHNTVRSWLSVLDASYITFRLRPWHRNLGKRLIKSPKIYFWDTGLVCYLLGIHEPTQLRRHPLRGAIFETWVVSEALKWHVHRGHPGRAWFYRDQRALEADLIVETGAVPLAIEAKSAATVPSAPFATLTQVQELFRAAGEPPPEAVVIYGGAESQRRSAGRIVSWSDIERAFDRGG